MNKELVFTYEAILRTLLQTKGLTLLVFFCARDFNKPMTLKPTETAEALDLSSGISAFEAKQFAQALRLLTPLAERGNADAQYRIAIMYQNGLGVVRNEQKALQFMQTAAEQGHALAQHGLGFMYMEGDCVARDGAQAVNWFRRAAEQGLTGSQTTLAMMYEEGRGVDKNPEESRRWYQRAGFEYK